MACSLCVLVLMVAVSVVCRPSDIMPEDLLVGAGHDQPLWSTAVGTYEGHFLDLGDELLRYVIRAASYFLGSKVVNALFKGTFYLAERYGGHVLSMLEVDAAVLQGETLNMMKKIFNILMRYVHPKRTGITWLKEATSSFSTGGLYELTNYMGTLLASAGYTGAAYSLGYMNTAGAVNNTVKALEALMSHVPPRAALWMGRLVVSPLT